MKRDDEVYSLNKGYSPFIYRSYSSLMYCFPVASGHSDMEFEFEISEKDLDILKSSDFKFKALYYILFYEAQSTFGTGHPNPRKYKTEEFENVKKKVLYNPENEIELYFNELSKKRNLSKNGFEYFSETVFKQE